MLCVGNFTANVAAVTLYILLDSGAGSGEKGLSPPSSSVGRALVPSGVSASNTGVQDAVEEETTKRKVETEEEKGKLEYQKRTMKEGKKRTLVEREKMNW